MGLEKFISKEDVMELLKTQAPLIYLILRTLWNLFVVASMCLIISLCIFLIVYLFNLAKAR